MRSSSGRTLEVICLKVLVLIVLLSGDTTPDIHSYIEAYLDVHLTGAMSFVSVE